MAGFTALAMFSYSPFDGGLPERKLRAEYVTPPKGRTHFMGLIESLNQKRFAEKQSP